MFITVTSQELFLSSFLSAILNVKPFVCMIIKMSVIVVIVVVLRRTFSLVHTDCSGGGVCHSTQSIADWLYRCWGRIDLNYYHTSFTAEGKNQSKIS